MILRLIVLGLILHFGNSSIYAQDKFNVEFFLLSESGEAVMNAHIFIDGKTQMLSNIIGYSSTKLSKQTHHLKISHISYDSYVESFIINQDTTLYIILSSRVLETVEIKARNPIQVNHLSEINVEQLKSIPGILGNKDVIRSLTFIPGVSATTEGSVNFSVRGSESYQNAILLDRSQVFNISHLFGLLSTVNAEIVNDIKLYKNYIPARFGNAASSVVDISILKGNNERFKKKLEVGLTNLAYNINGPIIKDKLHLNFSGRSAFLGVISSPLYFLYHFGEVENYANYNLYDANLKLSYSPTPKDRISLHAYTSSDNAFAKGKASADNENITGFGWQNKTLNLSYYRTLGRGRFFNNFINYSNFNTNFYGRAIDRSEAEKLVTGFKRQSTYNNFNFQSEFNQSIARGLLRLGFQYDHSWFNPINFKSIVESEAIGSVQNIFRLNNFGVFSDNDYNLSSRLLLNFGARLSWYQSKSLSKLILEPRTSLKYSIGNDQFLEVSFAKLTQNKVQYPIVNFGLPLDIWIPISEEVFPPIVYHYNLSYVANHFIADNLTLTGSLYYKSLKDLSSLESVLPFLVEFGDNYTDYLLKDGKGQAYGMEVSLDFNRPHFNIFLGYHLGRSLRQFSGINNGEPYPFEFNRLHELNSYINLKLSPKWNFTGSFHFASGTPVTLPTAYIKLNEDFRFYLFEKRNNYRNPIYHRGDIAFSHTSTTKRDRLRTWTFSVYNFYYRKNAYDTTIDIQENDEFTIKDISVFPIIPSILYSLEF